MDLQFYTSVAKGLNLKVKNFLGLILATVEATRDKLERGPFVPSILNRISIRRLVTDDNN